MQPLTEQGSDGFANGIRLLVNNPRVQQRRPQGNAVFGAVSGRRSGSYQPGNLIAERVLTLLTVVNITLRVANACHPKALANAALPHPPVSELAQLALRTDHPEQTSLEKAFLCHQLPDAGRLKLGPLFGGHSGIQRWLEQEGLGEVVVPCRVSLGYPAPQNQRFGGEANDARLDKAEIGCGVSGRRTLGFRGPQEPGLDLIRRPQCFGCIFYCSKKRTENQIKMV